jgi:hypothetical protein
MSHPNTKSMVFPSGTSFEQRVEQRIGVCSDCSTAVSLSEAVQYKATWDSHFAHYYFCPTCNPEPGNSTFYDGNLTGTDGERIIDQVELSPG